MIANLLTIAGVDHVITLDLHVSFLRADGLLYYISDIILHLLGVTNARFLRKASR